MGILAYPSNFLRKRKQQQKSFDEQFEKILKAHGIENDDVVKKYLHRIDSRGVWRLYVRFWAELRSDDKYLKSLAFLKRYWFMAATYDGLSISIFFAILCVFRNQIRTDHPANEF